MFQRKLGHILVTQAMLGGEVGALDSHTSYRKGRRCDWNPSSSSYFSIRAFRAQMSKFELFELILSLKLDKRLPVEQFEATVSQSTVLLRTSSSFSYSLNNVCIHVSLSLSIHISLSLSIYTYTYIHI